eukprot:TRINITY_DN43_c0_g1_i1.p1 TRINITY_DN43_c0_g1~~TRINITY_DN43_c0_g1_i1.p1  ORF type:complete len:815 (+),score=147.70 TRINITY_DN43_c0_g1_i1:34-2478(+)
MRFGKRLDFSAVPQWRRKYITYKRLKKRIGRIQKAIVRESHNRAAQAQAFPQDATARAPTSSPAEHAQPLHGEPQPAAIADVQPAIGTPVQSLLVEERGFWDDMEANMVCIDQFYKDRLEIAERDKEKLLKRAAELDLVSEFRPEKIRENAVVSELSRLSVDLGGLRPPQRVSLEMVVKTQAKATNAMFASSHTATVPVLPQPDEDSGEKQGAPATTEIAAISAIEITTETPAENSESSVLSVITESAENAETRNTETPLILDSIMLQAEDSGLPQHSGSSESPATQKQSTSCGPQQEPAKPQQVPRRTRRRARPKRRQVRELREAFCEYYRGLFLLQRYCALNTEGFRKILKKYDKKFATHTRDAFFRGKLELKTQFYANWELNSLTEETEYLFSEAFARGNRHEAMKQLRLPEEEEPQWLTFRVGLFFGVSVVLFAVLVYWVFTTNVLGGDAGDIPALHAYRMVGLVILLAWMWGADMYFWTHNKIDHVLIFGFDPRCHHTYHAMFEGAACLTVAWLFFFLTYVIAKSDDLSPLHFLRMLDPHLYALIFVGVSLAFLLLFQIRSQFWLLRTLLLIVFTPLSPNSFKANFMCDQLNSLSIIFYDAESTACYFMHDYWHPGNCVCSHFQYIIRACLASTPSVWRLMQNVKQTCKSHDKWPLVNAGKYLSNILVSLCAGLHGTFPANPFFTVAWCILALLSTTYNYSWDLYFDWGMMRNFRRKPFLLRDTLMFRRQWVYYIVMLVNLLMRLGWVFTISPTTIGFFSPFQKEVLGSVLACIEIMRRGMWNVYRVENEHINNCDKYRVTHDIELVAA